MAISSVLTFTDPDQMETAHVAAGAAEMMPTAREGLAWHVTRVELDNPTGGYQRGVTVRALRESQIRGAIQEPS